MLKVARRERYANRAELLVVLSTTLGLRASELTRIESRARSVQPGHGQEFAILIVWWLLV